MILQETRRSIDTLATTKLPFLASSLTWWVDRGVSEFGLAIKILPAFFAAMSPNFASQERALKRWFGVRNTKHPFYQPVDEWLGLTETQVMAGLRHYIQKGGDPVAKAFLRATSPWIPWPEDLGVVDVVIEERVPRRGSLGGGTDRIDMVVAGLSPGGFGVVIEAKFGSDLRKNPLARYFEHATSKWKFREGFSSFLVLGRRCNERTSKVLSENKNQHWKFLSWHVFLIRFERELDQLEPDIGFAEFRQHIWRCV